jgi:hypothetical protein
MCMCCATVEWIPLHICNSLVPHCISLSILLTELNLRMQTCVDAAQLQGHAEEGDAQAGREADGD